MNAVSTDIIHLQCYKLDSYRGNYEVFHKTREERLKNQRKEYEAQKQYRDHIQVGKSLLFYFFMVTIEFIKTILKTKKLVDFSKK